jgi:hypothetical protein
MQNEVVEFRYTSSRSYRDPFNQIEMDAVFAAGSREWRVPAYWAGGNEWRVRFAAPAPGAYRFRTVCSDTANAGLHGRQGRIEVSAYKGGNSLLRHGPLRVAKDRRHFEHADGAPFFWLGDTWWMGFTRRLRWPQGFRALTADRVAKGFSVIQIIAGLYPDMPPFDERGANEAGFPWTKGYGRINPAYFDRADHRVQWLVRAGLVPCIVGCWGYFLPWMGVEKLKKHWRYLVARWGAHPVVWCLAGEGAMPYYLSKNKEKDGAAQVEGWTEVARYVRQIDPYHHPVTIHPTHRARDQVKDDRVLDFDMLQTGHGGDQSVPNTVEQVTAERRRKPAMPVLVGEVNYEGILHGTSDEIQRLVFWACMLSGAAGHTYGANGIWQVNTRRRPFGPSPHGGNWGNQPWEDAHRLPGSGQLGLAKRLLERCEWRRFEPHQEWVEPCAGKANYFGSYAAGIPRNVRVIYSYHPNYPWAKPAVVRHIERGVRYRAFFFDPRTGVQHPLGKVRANRGGEWPIPMQPTMQDWVLVLEAT